MKKKKKQKEKEKKIFFFLDNLVLKTNKHFIYIYNPSII